MIDASSTISTYLESNWTGSTITITTDYFDLNANYPQIVVKDEDPGILGKNLITPKIYKIAHRVVVEVYIQPDKFGKTAEDTAKASFQDALTEIDRILSEGVFSVPNIRKVKLMGWNWLTDRTIEPLVYTGRQIVECIYWEDEN